MANDALQRRLYLENTGRICFFPMCVPKSRDYVVFPFNRNSDFENWWVKSGWANVISLERLPSKILICEEHFEKDLINRRYKVPRLALGSLPTRNIECPVKQREPTDSEHNKELFLHRVFCRLCGQMQSSNLEDDLPLLKKLDVLFQHQLQLTEPGLLPHGVCGRCKETTNVIQSFFKECTDAQETLKTIFNSDHTIIVPDPPVAEIVQEDSCYTEEIASANLKEEDHMYLNKECFPVECEEIEIDSTSQHIEETLADEYVYESYGEELPHMQSHPDGTATIGDEIDINDDGMELMQDNYTIEYVDDSSSQELPAAFPESLTDEATSSNKSQGKKPKKQEVHICEICGKSLQTLHRLRCHLSIHSSERDHQCNICGSKFKVRRALMEHIESKHERKLFPCAECGVKYRWQKGLQRHMASHKGKPLKHCCRVCNKSFPVPHKLRHHMMLHTGDRIECDICGKGYRFNYMLTQHKIRVHNMVIEGVKLYSSSKKKKAVIRKK